MPRIRLSGLTITGPQQRTRFQEGGEGVYYLRHAGIRGIDAALGYAARSETAQFRLQMIDPVEKPELIPFPSEPTRREIAAFSVIVARCGVPKEHFGRLTIDNINHADQGTGRKVHGPMTAEL